MSNIPIAILALFQLSREQAHQALTGREERDFLSHKTKTSKQSRPPTGFNRDLSNLFPKRKEKDQFAKLAKKVG